MLWNLLRVHLWIERRLFLQGPLWRRLVSTTLLLGMGAGTLWVYKTLVQVFRAGEGLFNLAAFVPTVLVMLIFFLMAGLADTLQRLYLSSDMDLLMVAPIPSHILYVGKLLLCSQSLWLPAFFLGAVLMALGQGQSAPLLYFPLALCLLLALLLFLTVSGVAIVIGLARIVPPKQARNLIPVLLMLVSLISIGGQQFLARSLVQMEGLMSALAAATLEIPRFATVAGIAVAGALLWAMAGYGLFVGAFYRGWLGMRESAPKRVRGAGKRRDVADLMLRFFSPLMRQLLLKDLRIMMRSPRQWVDLFIIPVMMLVLLFPMLKPDSAFHAIGFWVLLVYSGLFMVNASQGTGLIAMAEEGPNFALLRASPVSPSTFLWAKFLVKCLPPALIWTVVYIVAGLLVKFTLAQVAVLMLFMLWCMAGTTFLGLAIGARSTRFNVENIKLRITQLAAWGEIGLSLVFILAVFLSFSVGILQFAPQSGSAQAARQALVGFPPSAWLFERSAMAIVIAGLVGQGLVLTFGWRLWRGAVHHLKTWEIA
ncbi:MAG: ABC transporter permease [Anaerolineae bacterium]|nr:ABC transporter permease [Anaerolineae bacterium]